MQARRSPHLGRLLCRAEAQRRVKAEALRVALEADVVQEPLRLSATNVSIPRAVRGAGLRTPEMLSRSHTCQPARRACAMSASLKKIEIADRAGGVHQRVQANDQIGSTWAPSTSVTSTPSGSNPTRWVWARHAGSLTSP